MKDNKLEICMDNNNVKLVVDKNDFVIDSVRFLLDFVAYKMAALRR